MQTIEERELRRLVENAEKLYAVTRHYRDGQHRSELFSDEAAMAEALDRYSKFQSVTNVVVRTFAVDGSEVWTREELAEIRKAKEAVR